MAFVCLIDLILGRSISFTSISSKYTSIRTIKFPHKLSSKLGYCFEVYSLPLFGGDLKYKTRLPRTKYSSHQNKFVVRNSQ